MSSIVFQLILCWFFIKVSSHEMGEIRFGIANFPPYLVITKDLNSTVVNATGPYASMYDWLARRSNLQYKLIPVNQIDIEKMGDFTAAIQQLLNDEVDIAALLYAAIAERLKLMEFSPSLAVARFQFLTRLPGDESRVWAVIRPFQPEVWLVLLITVIVMVFILSLLSFYNQKRIETKGLLNKTKLTELLSENFTFATATLTNQGSSITSSNDIRVSFRILAGAWFLVGLVIVNSYAGLLISSLTVRKMKPVIDSFEDLVTGKDAELTLAVNVDTVIGRDIMNAQTGILKMVGDHLRLHPDGQYRTVSTGKDRLASMRYAVLEGFMTTNYYMGLDYKLNNRSCRYWESQPVDYYKHIHLAMRINGNVNRDINKAVFNLMEVGLYNYWMNQEKEKLRYDKCEAKDILKPSTQEKTPIKLSDTVSGFIVLGIGILASVFILTMELYT